LVTRKLTPKAVLPLVGRAHGSLGSAIS